VFGLRVKADRLENIFVAGQIKNQHCAKPARSGVIDMTDNQSYGLLLSAIRHLKIQYASRPSSCIALAISRQYRWLAEICDESSHQIDYFNQSSLWFNSYRQNKDKLSGSQSI
jgi:hypothetical protein